MDFWIDCGRLTVRTGTAAVWVCGKWVGDVGGWANKLGQGFGQSWDRKLSQVANGSKFCRLNWGHGQAVAALQNE